MTHMDYVGIINMILQKAIDSLKSFNIKQGLQCKRLYLMLFLLLLL